MSFCVVTLRLAWLGVLPGQGDYGASRDHKRGAPGHKGASTHAGEHAWQNQSGSGSPHAPVGAIISMTTVALGRIVLAPRAHCVACADSTDATTID